MKFKIRIKREPKLRVKASKGKVFKVLLKTDAKLEQRKSPYKKRIKNRAVAFKKNY